MPSFPRLILIQVYEGFLLVVAFGGRQFLVTPLLRHFRDAGLRIFLIEESLSGLVLLQSDYLFLIWSDSVEFYSDLIFEFGQFSLALPVLLHGDLNDKYNKILLFGACKRKLIML